MIMSESFAELVASANIYKDSWHETEYRLAWKINVALWEAYDPEDSLYFPTVQHWDKLLQKVIDNNSYDKLMKDEVLSILFGLHHRNRIIDGLWCGMFERGISQKLLGRLLMLDTDKHR